jgi:hypothetical protein
LAASGPDAIQHAEPRAREQLVEGKDGFRKPSHGHGLLRNWQPGNQYGGKRSSRYYETVQYAREHSMEALRALVERLYDPDGRIVVVAANSILERAFGRPKEQKPEEQEQVQLDLSSLTREELGVLFRLAQSGRLRSVPTGAASEGPQPEIDAKAESE